MSRMNWINVKERLPQERTQSFLISVNGEIMLAKFYGDEKIFISQNGESICTCTKQVYWWDVAGERQGITKQESPGSDQAFGNSAFLGGTR